MSLYQTLLLLKLKARTPREYLCDRTAVFDTLDDYVLAEQI